MKPEIIYVYDGICSWCYGFEAQMQKLFEELHEAYDFRFVSGGMFPAQYERRIKDAVGENFREAYARVKELSGADISEKYLGKLVGEENYIVNSDKTAQAFSAFNQHKPSQAQQLAFITQMQSETVQEDVQEDYAYARALQVNSFPQVFLKTTDGKYYLIAKGYSTAEKIAEIIHNIENE